MIDDAGDKEEKSGPAESGENNTNVNPRPVIHEKNNSNDDTIHGLKSDPRDSFVLTFPLAPFKQSMSPIIATGKHRRQVRFPSTNQPVQKISTPARLATTDLKRPRDRSASSKSTGKMATGQEQPRPGIPALFTQPPPIRDSLVTETVDLQDATLEKCLPFLKGIHSTQKSPFNACGVPALQRDDHVGYLYDSLEDYPAGFVALDASRPWMVYWALAGLFLLGEDVTRVRER